MHAYTCACAHTYTHIHTHTHTLCTQIHDAYTHMYTHSHRPTHSQHLEENTHVQAYIYLRLQVEILVLRSRDSIVLVLRCSVHFGHILLGGSHKLIILVNSECTSPPLFFFFFFVTKICLFVYCCFVLF